MGKKSTPKAPTPPDPVQTAAAQTQSNVATANAEANLNRSNQVTPWGTSSWTPGELGPDGTPQWTQTITLSPEQQELLNNDNEISRVLAQLGIGQARRAAEAIGQPIDYASLSPVQNAPLNSKVDTRGLDAIKNVQSGSLDFGENLIPERVATRGLKVGQDELAKAMQDAQRAAYGMQTQYLDSQYAQRQKDLETQLINQGVLQGSEAWDRATQNLGQQRTFDYNNAYNNSFDKGLAANNQLFNQDVTASNLLFGQDLAGSGQYFDQGLQKSQFYNNAQAQQFNQGLANANLSNSANQGVFNARLQNAQLGNQASSQGFNQSSAQRNQQLAEMLQQQQQPLNLLNAIRSGAQVTSPEFGATPQTGVSGTDIASMIQNQYNGQLNGYNAQMAQRNAILGGLFGLGSAAILA